MNINTFRQKFKSFSQSEQDFLKLLAIACEPFPLKMLTSLLENAEVVSERGHRFSQELAREYVTVLEESGWLGTSLLEVTVEDKYLEPLMRMAVIDPRFKRFVRAIQKVMPYREYAVSPRNYEVCLRELRIALYEGDEKRYGEVMHDLRRFYKDRWANDNFLSRFFQPFDPEWLGTFSLTFQALAMEHLLKNAVDSLEPAADYVKFVFDNNALINKELKDLLYRVQEVMLLSGDFDRANELADLEPQSLGKTVRKGIIWYFKNQPMKVAPQMGDGLLTLKNAGLMTTLLPVFHGAIFVFSLMKEEEKEVFKKIHAYLKSNTGAYPSPVFSYLDAAVFYQENDLAKAMSALDTPPATALECLFFGAACWWNERPVMLPELDKLNKWLSRAQQNGYRWLEMEFSYLLARLERDKALKDNHARHAEYLRVTLGVHSFLDTITRTERWERSLNALLQLQANSRKRKATADRPEKNTRLVWWVDFATEQVQPIEQTFSKGLWSKGRNVSLKRLKETGVDNMTDQDRLVAKAIKISNQGFYGAVEFAMDFQEAIIALVEHPLVFLMENPAVSVELVEKEPQLMVEAKPDGYDMRFSHDFRRAGVALVRETPTRYIVLKISELHEEINRLIDFGRLQIPAPAKDKLIEVIGNVSSMINVQSEVGGEAYEVQTIPGDPVPHLHLLPVGSGFKLEFFVKPFSSEPPYFKAGIGRENVIAEVEGVPMRALRDLKKEVSAARRVEDSCPTLVKIPSDSREWLFDDTEDCLAVLLELEPLRETGEVVMEYPKGEKIRIAGNISFDNLSMGIKKERDWFEVSGQVRVNENLVLDFKQLLDLTQNAKVRFVQIGDGQFLALTNQFRRKLDELNNLFTKTKNELRFHPLAATMFDEFAGLLHDVEVDSAWKKQLSRLRESRELHVKVPSTFKAELRPYQEDGFRWLNQMAWWGVGACLADDMGLGKTVQALALMLERAKLGPQLVLAPASVVRNWWHESRRFTPTLNPIVFGETDRRSTLDNLQPFDLLLCSYGLLQQEGERFSEKHFTTIVLDEAQAIKNRTTKRSQAAMQLQGDFKVITTGTPVENHLGELWNLFNFLNPGLLGTIDRFTETYAMPIEKLNDKERRNQLRRLIQPFILRRRKNDVLEELPEKTEITLSVELSAEERAFYEALRRKALENIEGIHGDPGQKRFQILAELMRLRQACCHPRMVAPESKLSSSKLGLIAETVEELLEGGHKALIFSQFVKHLRIVEEWVKARGITYQYLDGSTPLPQRDKAIRAFQAGDGDLFLISLKAGGFGLNLTAADYVLHLDPWWNPAVEDQASDRAHRIGQLRPVTIYRMITENTIEEKILQLHSDKRELADSLLEGTEVSGSLSADELLSLIKG